MMKCVLKKMSSLALSVVMVLCFMQESYSSPNEEKPEVPRNIQLSVGTLSVGSLFYNVALALSTNMEDKLPWIVTPRPIASTLALPVNVSNKQLDFSIITNIDNYHAYRGTGPFEEKHTNLRIILGGGEMFIGMVTHTGTGIETYEDIKGNRFTWRHIGAGSTTALSEAVIEAYGWEKGKDFRALTAEHVGPAYKDLAEGHTDVTTNAINPALIEETAVRVDPVLLPLPDDDMVDKILELAPYFHTGELYRDYATLIKKGMPSFAVLYLLQTHKDLPDAVAYHWVKTFYENWEEIYATSPENMEGWGREKMVTPAVNSPYHPGAVKFYKEKGMWSEEMEEIQARLLAEGNQD